jgi:hypothetical protein
MYIEFMRSLLSVCENIHTISVPVRWSHKVDSRTFPNLRVTYIKGDGNYS